MSNFIKNITITDYISNRTLVIVTKLLRKYNNPELYYVSSPNIVLHYVIENFLSLTYPDNMLHHCS